MMILTLYDVPRISEMFTVFTSNPSVPTAQQLTTTSEKLTAVYLQQSQYSFCKTKCIIISTTDKVTGSLGVVTPPSY